MIYREEEVSCKFCTVKVNKMFFLTKKRKENEFQSSQAHRQNVTCSHFVKSSLSDSVEFNGTSKFVFDDVRCW